jgi:hypothetical protein
MLATVCDRPLVVSSPLSQPGEFRAPYEVAVPIAADCPAERAMVDMVAVGDDELTKWHEVRLDRGSGP